MAERRFQNPTAGDQFEYLLRLYFGRDHDPLSRCIRRAYRDMNRTLHGFAEIPEGKRLHCVASDVVRSFLTGLADARRSGISQDTFDDRHKAACKELCSTYPKEEFKFHVGQAQKWLNMALKYVLVYGEERLPGYAQVFALAHIPLDNIILDVLRNRNSREAGRRLPALGTPWSRIEKYEDYMSIQRWVRNEFPDSAPLAVEFRLYLDSGGSDLPAESTT